MKRRQAFLIFIFPFLLLGACSSQRDTPEEQVRALLKRGEAAAEKKETAVLRQLISDKYSDSQGQDKKSIEALLRFYFLRHESIHLLTRVQSVTFMEPIRAQTVILVAMAAQPIGGVQELQRLRADLYRFELTFVNDSKEWKLVRAEWRPSELNDFL